MKKSTFFNIILVCVISITIISCSDIENFEKTDKDQQNTIDLKSTTRYYVYSPFNGTQWGQSKYCDNTEHKTGINYLCCPTDLNGATNTPVIFRCSGNISSIRTIKTGPSGNGNNGDALCWTAPSSAFSWVNEGVKVELYAEHNGQGYIGTVFYGHLKNRIFNGVYNNPNNLTLGKLGNADCNCDCYDGIHTHMERSTNGTTVPRACYTPISTSTIIYYFDCENMPY